MSQPLPLKPSPSLAALEALFRANTELRMRLAALQALAKRAQVGSDLEKQLAASLLVSLAAQDVPALGDEEVAS